MPVMKFGRALDDLFRVVSVVAFSEDIWVVNDPDCTSRSIRDDGHATDMLRTIAADLPPSPRLRRTSPDGKHNGER